MDNFCIALFFKRNEHTALGRAVLSFEAYCQWAVLSVQIIRLVKTQCDFHSKWKIQLSPLQTFL